ncbi:MAG: DUF3368 domain-containing protein [Acidobacteriota bacterium]
MLARAGRLELLRAAGERVVVPGTVAEEVTAHSDEAARALESVEWLEVTPGVQLSTAVAAWDLGPGESAVLSWAAEHPGAVSVLDDYAARTCAKALGLPLLGTLGLALRAKVNGEVNTARPVVEELVRAGLYLSDSVIREALSLVGE